MKNIEITEAEWIAELERHLSKANDEGFTVREWHEVLQMPYERVQKIIRQLVQNGTMQRGERYVARDWDGRGRTYTVYKLAKKSV